MTQIHSKIVGLFHFMAYIIKIIMRPERGAYLSVYFDAGQLGED
jgi:hypothetical protein